MKRPSNRGMNRPRYVRLTPLFFGLLATLIAVACEPVLEVTTGTLVVSVTTSGGDLDLDGYAVSVNGGADRPLGLSGAVWVAGLPAGQHTVELRGVAPNCTVAGTNPTTVTLGSGDTLRVAFAVTCVLTGVRITAGTTGFDLDPDGFTAALDGQPPVALPQSGSLVITRLTPGDHTVTLGGVADNCDVDPPNPRTVSIAAGQLLFVPFAVTCRAVTGAVRVIVATTGADLDPDGYLLQLDGGSEQGIGVNATRLLAHLAPGSHTVHLGGLAPNCAPDGEDRTVDVVVGETAEATFTVGCRAYTGTVVLRTATTGLDLDPDGYVVRLDDGAGQAIGPNATVTLLRVVEGSHTIALEGAAPNCAADDPNPRPVTLVAGETVEVTFAVTCQPTSVAVRVITPTTGADRDPDGYWVIVDGDDYYPWYKGVDDTLLIHPFATGQHTFQLGAVAPNCRVTGENPRTATVAAGFTDVVFAVECTALGSVQVSVTTTGLDLDPNGYTVTVTGLSTGSADVAVNGTVTISRLAAGDHDVGLGGTALNCDVVGANPRPVAVPSGVTVAVAFGVTCAAAGQLAYATNVDGNDEIYLIKSNGTGATRLTTNPASDTDPGWSPDGAMIAFVSNRDGNSEIYVMNASGSGVTRLTTNAATDNAPAWSPDGSKIAFVSERDGNAEIYVMDANGSNPVRLTIASANDYDPAWSPDGSKIAFWSFRDGHAQVYVMNANGSGATRLGNTDWDDHYPTWSPDGTRIAFQRLTDCYYWCDYDILVMNADGLAITPLPSGAVDTRPAWSPDGRWIAFETAYCEYNWGCSAQALSAVRPDGTGRVEITSSYGAWPAWRP